jgi:cation diffusion facilitator family transporter
MEPVERDRAVRRTLWWVLWLNLAVTAAKLGIGLYTGALSVIADGFQSLGDSSSNIIGLFGVWVASRPADENHPYGHQKYETIATLTIGGMLLIAAFEIGRSAVERMFGAATELHVTPLAIGLMIATFIINLGVSVYEARAGRRLNSMVVTADAAYTRSGLAVTITVIGALVADSLGLTWLDAVVAALVVAVIFRAAFGILRSTSNVLSDMAVADRALVENIARGVPGVAAVAAVRSRGRSDAAYVDLHIRVHPAMDADQAHGVASEVERRLAQAMPGVVDTVVHVEPEWSEEPRSAWEELALKLRSLADGLGLGLHDLHAHVERDGRYAVELHVEMRADLTLAEAHAVADHFERRAQEALPQLASLVTHLEPLPNAVPDETGRESGGGTEAKKQRLKALADDVAGPGACHEVIIHDVSGHLTATLHVTQPGDMPLMEAHALAERIERRLHSHEAWLSRVVVHVEPPDSDHRQAT